MLEAVGKEMRGGDWASEKRVRYVFVSQAGYGDMNSDLPALGTSWPGVILCCPTVNSKIFDVSLLMRDSAVSTLLFAGIFEK